MKMPIANDESKDDLQLYVFVQEMHDKYEKYADAKIPLSSLCKIGQKGGGWIELDESSGQVLLSSIYNRIEKNPQVKIQQEDGPTIENENMQGLT